MKKITLFLLTTVFSLALMSQCNEDSHSTNWFDGWVSCDLSTNPNSIRGNSHWIHYDLGAQYYLGQTHFWNVNDPAHRNYGLKNIVIDYSTDGITWTELDTHFLFQGPGIPSYAGVDGPDFDGIQARYVLITAIDNWGGSCYGMSEMKIDVETPFTIAPTIDTGCLTASIYPNPVTTVAAAWIGSLCSGNVTVEITNVVGNVVETLFVGPIDVKTKVSLPVENLVPGVYFVTFYQRNTSITKQIIIL